MDNLLRALGLIDPKQEVRLLFTNKGDMEFYIYIELKDDKDKPLFKQSFPREEFGLVWAVVAERILTFTLFATVVNIPPSFFPQINTLLKNPNSCIKYLYFLTEKVPKEVLTEVLQVMHTNTCQLQRVYLRAIEEEAEQRWVVFNRDFRKMQAKRLPVQNNLLAIRGVRRLPVDLVRMLSGFLI